MKLIEAMKRVKLNKTKIADIQKLIGLHCANLSYETKAYDNPATKIHEWMQACTDISQENAKLITSIWRTNLNTQVPISVGGQTITKSIAEWLLRRSEYAQIDLATWKSLTDKGLREGQAPSTILGGQPMQIKIERHYSVEERDKKIAIYATEAREIDSAMEVINATTDLIEI